MFSSTIIYVIFGCLLGFFLSWCNTSQKTARFWVITIVLCAIFIWYGETVAKEKVELLMQPATTEVQNKSE